MFVVTAVIFFASQRAVAGPSGSALTQLSPGMLPPLSLIFGLIVGFLVAGLWANQGDARDAVDHEASALRSTALIAEASFPGPTASRIDALVARHIHNAATSEWPAMADQRADLTA